MSESAPSNFPAPKPQDLTLLARKIQQNDNEYVLQEIKKNPRLLASSTDNPTVLQEGFRYNALHIASRFGNAEAVRIILSAVNGVSFMKSLYPDDSQHIRDGRTKYLTDMYLNAPDKGTLETPLHFSCKFNFYDVAKILIGHPLCDITLKNRDGSTPKDIVGSRSSKLNIKNGEKILKLFEETFIVPIWRDLTNDSSPFLGRPVNPKYLGQFTPPPFTSLYGDVVLEHFGPIDLSLIPKPAFGIHREIRAYVGPTDKESAMFFYSSVKGTSALTHGALTPPLSNSPGQGEVIPMLPKTPTRKLVRKTTHETPSKRLMNCGDNSESTFRDPSTPPSQMTPKKRERHSTSLLSPKEFEYTPKTLSMLLTSPGRSLACSTPPSMLEDRKVRLRDPEKGLERVARKYAAEYNLPWKEYWIFLGEFTNLASEEGLVLLEDHLYKGWEYEIKNNQMNKHSELLTEVTPFTAICVELEKLNIGSGNTPQPMKWKDVGEDWRSRIISNGTEPTSVTNQNLTNTQNLFFDKLQNGNAGLSITEPREITQEKFKMGIRKLFPKLDESVTSNESFEDLFTNFSGFDSEDDEKCSWKTSRSRTSSTTTSDSEDYEDCDTCLIYINGTKPSKEDYQALHAISSVVENLSIHKFPHVIGWYNSLKATNKRIN